MPCCQKLLINLGHYIICSSVLLSHLSIALEKEQVPLNTILKQVDHINTSGFPFNSCQNQCNFKLDMEKIKEENRKKVQLERENLHQCAVDLCGPPNKNPRFMINNQSFTNEEDEDILKQFDKQVRPHIRQGRNRAIQYYSNNLAELSSELQAQPNRDKWDQTAGQIIRDYVSFARQPKIRNKDMDPQTRTFLTGYLEDYNALKAEVTKQIKAMSIEEMRQFIISQRDKYDSTIQKDPRLSKYEREKWKKDTTLKTTNVMTPLLTQQAISVGVFSEQTKRPSCAEQAICKKAILEEIAFQQEALQQQAQEEESYMNYCKSIFNEAISAIKQAQSFEQKLPKYIDQITENVFADYSSQSRQQFQNVINDMKFPLPSTDTVESNFIDRISANSKLFSKSGSWKYHTRSSQINQICPSSYINSLSDSTVTTYNTSSNQIQNQSINLSFMSCTFHDHGKGILAHEMGHTISQMFNPNNPEREKVSKLSRDKYQNLRKCATNIYKTPKQIQSDPWNHPNDKLHTEEDTADLMASMAFKDSPTYSFCMLLSTDDKGSKYEKLAIGFPPPSTKIVLENADISSAMNSTMQIFEQDPDPHSGAFLRVLIEAQHKKTKLSSACQKVVDRFKDRINFEPCF